MNILKSFFIGLFWLIVLFLFSAITVIGVKAVITFFLGYNYKESEEETQIKKPKRKKSKKPSFIKSIEINPNEIDRIYVKRS